MKKTFTFTAKNGGMSFSDFMKAHFKQHLLDHEGRRYVVQMIDKGESKKMRRWYHGALVPLIAYYQEGMDHKKWEDCDQVHGWLKQHFNSDICVIGGVTEKVAKSTKGELKDFVERVLEWLEGNYEPPQEALDPKKYKKWRDTIFPYGGPDNYIDYLVEKKVLRLPEQCVILN